MLRSMRKVDRVGRASRRGRNRKKHVVIIVQNLPVPLDRRVWMECLALVGAWYAVSVVCPKGPGDPAFETLQGVRIHKYAPPPPARGIGGYLLEFVYCWAQTAFRVVRIALRDRIDVIQTCNPPDTFFALALPFKALGVRFIFDQHDLCPELYESRFGKRGGLVLSMLKALEQGNYRVADHVISTNDSYRQVALTRGGHSADTVTVVRSGPDPDAFRAGAPDPRLKKGATHLCCYLGVMGHQDGVDLVLRAVEVIVRDFGRRDCQFALLGFGDCYDDLVELTRELDLSDWVTFTGRVGIPEIASYLSTADVGLTPDPKTVFNDVSTMNKTLEYMAFGVPVVASDLRETRASAGDAAVYVRADDARSFAEAIVALLDDPARRLELGTWACTRRCSASNRLEMKVIGSSRN
jgi:glycosyltransferase involved in cell wall biosynthesis